MKIEMSISNKIEVVNAVLLITVLLFFVHILKTDILKLDDPYHNIRKSLDLKTPNVLFSGCAPENRVFIGKNRKVNIQKLSNLFDIPKTTKPKTKTQPTRKPIKQAKPEKPKKNYQRLLNQISVNGLMKGASPKVVIYNKRTGETSFVGVGDTILDTFKVTSIEDNQVSLEADGRNFFLKF